MSIRISSSQAGAPLITLNDAQNAQIEGLGVFGGNGTIAIGSGQNKETLVDITNLGSESLFEYTSDQNDTALAFHGSSIVADLGSGSHKIIFDASESVINTSGGSHNITTTENAQYNFFALGEGGNINATNNGKYNIYSGDGNLCLTSEKDNISAVVMGDLSNMLTLKGSRILAWLGGGDDEVIDYGQNNYVNTENGNDKIASFGNNGLFEGGEGNEVLFSGGNNNLIFSDYVTPGSQQKAQNVKNNIIKNDTGFISYLKILFPWINI